MEVLSLSCGIRVQNVGVRGQSRSYWRELKSWNSFAEARHWSALCKQGIPHHCWLHPWSWDWWDNLVLCTWGNEQWIRNFMLSWRTLHEITEELIPCFQRWRTVMRQLMLTEKHVALTVWWLAKMACHREVSQQFAVGLMTVTNIITEVCFTIELVLLCRTVMLGDMQRVSTKPSICFSVMQLLPSLWLPIPAL